MAGMQVYSITGSTHPSFADVALILPSAINKLQGLKCPAQSVLNHAVRATDQFLSGPGGSGGNVIYDEEFVNEESGKTKTTVEVNVVESGGRKKPVGQHGKLAWHRL